MKKFTKIIMGILLVGCFVFGSTLSVFADDSLPENSTKEYLETTIPVFDSVIEAELSFKSSIRPLAEGDEGGTEECWLSPYIARTNSLMENCVVYLHYESNFRIESVRFKELIVEKSYLVGKNYLKLPTSGSSYYTVKLNSYYNGYRTLRDDVKIPTDVKSVVVRTKNLGVFRYSTSSWLAAKYQIGGRWQIDPKRPF